MASRKKQSPAPVSLQAQLRERIASDGIERVAKMCGISAPTIGRVAAGAGVQPATRMAISAALDQPAS